MVDFIFVGGPLGSGKTTLINALAPGLERIASVGAAISDLGVLNDDYRRINLDKRYVNSFKAGCVCCERKEDLMQFLKSLPETYDYFFIEPSGASNIYDLIQAVDEQSINRPDFNVRHVFATLPARNWEEVKNLRAMKSAIQASNLIILTKTNSTDYSQILSELHSWNIDTPTIVYNAENKDLSSIIIETPRWIDPLIKITRGHEHFDRMSFSLPHDYSIDDISRLLLKFKDSGAVRSKGVIPKTGIEFDLAYGENNISNYYGNLVAARGTVIFNDNHKGIIQAINSINYGSSSDLRHGLESASVEDLLKAFNYYYNFSGIAIPSFNEKVLSNFEGTDDAYTLAKEIYLKTNCGETAPLEMALIPYIKIRLDGLKKLKDSVQEDKNYIGVMLCSYMIQMLGDKDNVPFDRLIEPAIKEKIIMESCPAYFNYLSNFGKEDLRFFANNDKHFNFFAWMAERAEPFEPDKNKIIIAAENMLRVNSNDDSCKGWGVIIKCLKE